MEFKDYYKILGLAHDADNKTIKIAYRKLAKKYHPDVSDHYEAEEKFKEVTEAYDVLKNTEKRAEYDEIRKYGSHGQRFQPPPGWQSPGGNNTHGQDDYSEFFSSMFGRRSHQAEQAASRSGSWFNQKGQDIETDMPVFLEDTLSDTSKAISYRLPHVDNEGRVTEIKKTLNVKIPAGVDNGERIRLKGQGGKSLGGGPNGDLYLRIRLVPHPLFDVEAHNLIVAVPLAPWEAALGAKIDVPTLSGKIKLSVPANSQTGQRLRIKGKGLLRKDGRGDLYAVLKVVMPTTTNEEIKQQWEQLASKAAFNPRSQWSN
ncbi:MAG: curved DNA-binding protein [Cellvibrionaceae bacterium]|jgi:curved DNA-binding protein